jgi:parallel beta-helix repeat protein
MKYIWTMTIVFVIALVAWNAESVFAAKLYVSNNGVDSATCGEKKNPCRSISRAIQNAISGDTVIVGSGRYGDLNGDGIFDDPGDEAAEVSSGCYCMIKVNKPLSLESRDGAAATVLDAGGIAIDVVRIEASASGTVLGNKRKKGFSLTRGFSGLYIVAGSGVRILGNLASANSADGFNFSGSGHVITGNQATDNNEDGFDFNGSGNLLTGNVASANGYSGFIFRGSGHVLTGNQATNNNEEGFVFLGSDHVLTGNVATDNGSYGFDFNGSGNLLTGNVASANGLFGFNFSGSGHLLSGNSALGNKGFGIFIFNSGDVDSATITKNNLFGNNNHLLTIGIGGKTFTNCGLLNQSGDSFSAPNNFWGTTAGPGTFGSPQPEPADNVCDDPVVSGSSTTVPSFATKEFKVKIKALEELPTEAVSTSFNTPEAQLHVYSLTGQLAAIVADQRQLALATRSLANSVYLAVKIYADGRRELMKWVVAK